MQNPCYQWREKERKIERIKDTQTDRDAAVVADAYCGAAIIYDVASSTVAPSKCVGASDRGDSDVNDEASIAFNVVAFNVSVDVARCVIFADVMLPMMMLLTWLSVRAPWHFSDSSSGGIDYRSSKVTPLQHSQLFAAKIVSEKKVREKGRPVCCLACRPSCFLVTRWGAPSVDEAQKVLPNAPKDARIKDPKRHNSFVIIQEL